MIASRNQERLSKSAEIMKTQIRPENVAQLEYIQCNIRKEDQVLFKWFLFDINTRRLQLFYSGNLPE